MSGKIGTVVGATWRGKNIIRTLPRKSSKRATGLQLNQRSKFRLISNFLRQLNPLLNRYFGSKQGLKSRVNLALSYHLNEATDQLDEQEQEFVVVMEKVIVSKGIFPSIVMETVKIENENLTLSWVNYAGGTLAKDSDLLTVVVFNKHNQQMQIFEKVALRKARQFTSQLPLGFDAANCVIWFFLTNEIDTACSTSMLAVLSE
ncbi:DUF6266 family protein [Myroides odoratus]|uniref:DUF6266 family protein n=1 Tax=Myroides odoratus TaxID=256 RepID=UPI0039AEAF87